MLNNVFKKVFGSRNDRIIKDLRKLIISINTLEEQYRSLTDDQLQAKTPEFRQRLEQGESLDTLISEAFATVREASIRVMGMRHYDVQLIGAIVLHQGKIAEMRTGEGKTLMATLAAYLNALPGTGVHIVTVNDYLAKRDSKWMEPLFSFLGLTVGVVVPDITHEQRQAAYAADITYGTNNEYGFDYLRDNMAFSIEDKVQRNHSFAIIDEVDSILIDEARTPLIISGPTDDSSELYYAINNLTPKLVKQEEEDGPGDFTIEEKNKQIYLTEEGHQHVEEFLMEANLLQQGESLYDAANISMMHHVNAALRAHHLYQKDVDYIVSNNEIVIVDEFTGRTMAGRRWSDGLHQAVEAKEAVTIQQENQTLASITFQNFFRIYHKLSGMTGTADTEAYEFQSIYGLEVVVIPTDKTMIREDNVDQVYLTAAEKYNAIMEDIRDCQKRGQPALVGTASIEVSEYISSLLTKNKINHEVLNAKQHQREAEIIAQAGKPGVITIATNMAGRGTDIVLGGNLDVELAKKENSDDIQKEKIRQDWKKRHQSVLDAGGLHIIGTERHESRRIDNQLRGRSGRQGDAGSSRFYLSLEDNLMRIFASEKISGLMHRLGMQEGEAIEHPWVSKAIENAQRKVEGHNFDIRKQLLEYDDVANDQRKVVYQQRSEIMQDDDVSETITAIRHSVVGNTTDGYVPPQSMEEQWDISGLEEALFSEFDIKMDLKNILQQDESLHDETLRVLITDESDRMYKLKEEEVGVDVLRYVEKQIMLQVLDREWKDHLALMDYLRQGIHLRGYAQKNPKQEYKRESFEMFSDMLDKIKHEIATVMSKIKIRNEEDAEAVEAQRRGQDSNMQFQHAAASSLESPQEAENAEQPFVRENRKIGRNEACPCGSGKKYKQCHGKL